MGKLDSPEVYSPLGVISWPSRPRALRMSIVAESDAMAIQTLRIPRKRPGQALKDKRRLEGQCEDGEPKGTVRSREVLPAAEPKGRMRELLRAAVGAREEAFGFERLGVVVHACVHRHRPMHNTGKQGVAPQLRRKHTKHLRRPLSPSG